MSVTFDDFLADLLSFESGWDMERYNEGIIQDWQLDPWAGGGVEAFFPQYSSWSQLMGEEWTAMAYRSTNSYGFIGYQFGEALLIDLGYYDDDFYYGNGAATNTWDGTWTGKNGVDSLEEFMTQDAQEVTIREEFGHNLGIIDAGTGRGRQEPRRLTRHHPHLRLERRERHNDAEPDRPPRRRPSARLAGGHRFPALRRAQRRRVWHVDRAVCRAIRRL